jgi:AraC-like DNA-binding protein
LARDSRSPGLKRSFAWQPLIATSSLFSCFQWESEYLGARMSDLTGFLTQEEKRNKFRSTRRIVDQKQTHSLRGNGGRGSLAGTGAESAVQNAGLPAARLKRVLAFIDTHLDENISLAALAQNAKLSVFYFATQFKRSTGLSPHRYILQRRVLRASELLRNTSLSVLDVSLDLGFQHQNNFARAFRRMTGMTPTRFRHTEQSGK